jgi:uncharacterized RDD family membrane protein YckC
MMHVTGMPEQDKLMAESGERCQRFPEMTTGNPYATPTIDPTLVTVPDTGAPLVLATLGERFAGALLDGLIGFVLSIPIWGVLFALGTVASVEEMGKVGPVLSIVMGLMAFVLAMAVQYVPLKQSGQTWGKRVMKTRIATMKGEQPTITDLVFKRYAFFNLIGIIPVVGMIASLVNILMIFRNDRRCLHDLIAGTQVVKIDLTVVPPVAP